jgi:large subunit ribosomal protein L5
MKRAREKARLEELYNNKIKPQLLKQLGLKNVMEVPKLSKVVLNIGVKDAVSDSKALQSAEDVLKKISGQLPVRTLARHSIAGFKLREGLAIGAKVTLRKRLMYEFVDRLINLSLPKVRDFQGVSSKLDGRGSYNLGIKEWTIFPEIEFELGSKIYGMNITIHTTTKNDEHARILLEQFGMPFKHK